MLEPCCGVHSLPGVNVRYLGQALEGHGILAGKNIGTQAVMWSSKDLRSPGTGRQLVRVKRADALKS